MLRARRIVRSSLEGILVATIVLVLMLIGLEILVRIVIPWKNDALHQCHQLYGVTGIPGVTGNYYGMEPSAMTVPKVVVHMNSKGLRDREYEYDKSDSFRILILGDSMVEALQVPLERTAQEVLEDLLNYEPSVHPRIEVISGAHSTWGTDNEYLFYREEGYKYQPDLVLLAIYPWNDVRNNSRDLEMAMYGSISKPTFALDSDGRLVLENFPWPCDTPPNSSTRKIADLSRGQEGLNMVLLGKKWLASRSHLYWFVGNRLHRLPKRLVELLIVWGILSSTDKNAANSATRTRFEIAEGLFFKEMPVSLQSAWTLTEKLILALRDEVKRNRGRFAIVVIPSSGEGDDSAWERLQLEASRFGIVDLDRENPSRIVVNFCVQYNIPALVTAPEFVRQRSRTNSPLFFKEDGHFTRAGNRLLAEMLASWLKERDLVLAGR